MPNKSERRQHRSFRRTASGTKMITKAGKHGRYTCALCRGMLHGVAHGKTSSGRGKQSKSQKGPSAPFAGILCGNCRTIVITEAAKVKAEIKSISDVRMDVRPYLSQISASVL